MSERHRWSDEQLETFHAEFRQHLIDETEERVNQQDLYKAVFQKENPDTNTPPGLLQLCGRMAKDLQDMKIANDRQKRFFGGIVFSFTCMGFFLTDSAHKLLELLKRL